MAPGRESRTATGIGPVRAAASPNIHEGDLGFPLVESGDDLLRAEYDADEAQDEILFKAGVYETPSRRPLVWKFLIVFGGVVLVLGLLFWAQINGLNIPELSLVPASLMTVLLVFLILLALGCLVAGVALAVSYRRDPYEMKPIR